MGPTRPSRTQLMLSRFLTLVAAVLASVAASGAAAAAGAPAVTWAVAAGVGFIGALRPAVGLMLVAAFAPLGGAIAALGGLATSATEPLVLSVLAGWLLRRTLRRESWDVVAVSLAGSLALIVLASLTVQFALVFQIAAPSGLTFPRAVLQWLTDTSDVLGPQRPEVPAALLLLEGCGLFAMAVEVCRREPSVAFASLRLLTLSVAAVAVLNINRFVEVVLRQDTDFWNAAQHVHQFLRVSSTIPDVNAAGALFALVLPPAVWLCLATSRRSLWSAVALAVAVGLWLSGSRAAMMGGVIGVLGFLVFFARRHWTRGRAAATLSVVLMAGAALIVWYPRAAAHTASHDAWVIRRQLAVVGFQMAREAPLFGIGVGRFFEESARLASPELRRYYSAQNAHNQVIQFLGELGVPGAALFLAVLACSLAPGSRGPDPPLPATLRGPVVFGILGVLVASVLMHPLLMAEVSAAFWLVVGLARAAIAPAQPHPGVRRAVAVPAFVAIVLAVTLPGRVEASRNTVNLDGVGVGVSGWRRDAEADIRYRSASASSAIYVDGRAGRLRLPVRMAGAGRVTTDVEVWFDGRPAGRLTLPSDVWTELSMLLPDPAPGKPQYRRLEFRWTPARSAARLDIGRERYYHHAGQAATQ
jgi:O-antigen ligase